MQKWTSRQYDMNKLFKRFHFNKSKVTSQDLTYTQELEPHRGTQEAERQEESCLVAFIWMIVL